MKSFACLLLMLAIVPLLTAQSLTKIIIPADVRRIENALSSDAMEGRKAFTAGAEKAADFISNEFKKIGLKTFNNSGSYKQTFTMVSPGLTSISAMIDSNVVDTKSIIPFTSSPQLHITEKSGYIKAYIKEGAQFRKELGEYLKMKENMVVFVDPSFSKVFSRLNVFRQHLFQSEKNVVFVLGNAEANSYNIVIKQEVTKHQGSNVVGVIPGKSRKHEMVIFSGHYDHLGTGKAEGNDSIYNGANDDASGITAVIEFAKYYRATKKNERTLVFAAFTAEEIGGFGSQYFSKQMDVEKVVAMFNIEMIGTESKWGKNSAYITGYNKSGLGAILQKNLKGTHFTFHPDPYPDEDLFYRSDNATLARLGVPAHTISTAKMEAESNYHKVTDELITLDIDNMTEIIKSVIVSARSVVDGIDLPSRVKVEEFTR